MTRPVPSELLIDQLRDAGIRFEVIEGPTRFEETSRVELVVRRLLGVSFGTMTIRFAGLVTLMVLARCASVGLDGRAGQPILKRRS